MDRNSLIRIAVVVALAAAHIACGGSANDGVPPPGGASGSTSSGGGTRGCTFQLSGAVQGTSPCGAVATKLLDGTTRVDIAASDSTTTTIDFVVQGDLKAATYDLKDGTASAVTVVTSNTAGNEWVASTGNAGSLTVQITAVAPSKVTGYFDVHGSATAVLPASMGSTGTVQLSATF